MFARIARDIENEDHREIAMIGLYRNFYNLVFAKPSGEASPYLYSYMYAGINKAHRATLVKKLEELVDNTIKHIL